MSRSAQSPAEVPAQYMPCRAFRHETQWVKDLIARGPGDREVIEFTRVARCDLCKTEVRTTYAAPDFRVTKRRYSYPDKYQVKGGFSVHDARGTYIQQRYGR